MSNLPDKTSLRDASVAGSPESDPPADLRGLRLLRMLVTLLTATMIVGIVALVALLYTRLPGPSSAPALPALPEALTLPEGTVAQAVTAGPGWWAVVTEAGDILLYSEAGLLVRTISVEELRGP